MRVTKTEYIFPTAGGEQAVPHGIDIPDNAYAVEWDEETLILSWTIPAVDEDSEATAGSATLTQADIDAAEQAANTPTYNVSDLIAQLWQSFNDHAEAETDLNSRASISLIIADPNSTAQQIQRAAEWGNWWAALWELYGQKRAEIAATEEPVTYELQPAPWTIWEIAE